jgi:hypothetical protein
MGTSDEMRTLEAGLDLHLVRSVEKADLVRFFARLLTAPCPDPRASPTHPNRVMRSWDVRRVA